MAYYVLRGQQQYGPYSLEDLRRYYAQGNLVAGDLVRSEESARWVPLLQVLGSSGPVMPPPPIVPGMAVPSAVTPGLGAAPLPPNLHWALVLLLGFVTCGLFALYWAFRQAGWVKRIVPRCNAILMYSLYVILVLLSAAVSLGPTFAGRDAPEAESLSWLLQIAASVCYWIGAFNIRSCLLEYYNQVEPI
ncbi:MAG: GYF domain-containing protein, partial [Bryobacteraceae bacterium]|nr:GYF domain-containing protein [Bryobacteraceae bacterium]